MKSFHIYLLAIGLLSAVASDGSSVNSQADADSRPVLVNTCLITARFAQLVDFYQRALGISPKVIEGNYAEFPTGVGVLAIFSAEA